MARVLILLYGVFAYACFFGTILYAIGFVENLVVPKGIDHGDPRAVDGLFNAVVINALLLGLFVVQHTIMARPKFKALWTRIIPHAMERSTFVLLASAALSFAMWQWRPMATEIWRIDQPFARTLLIGLSLLGWCLVFYSSFVIDHFDLFGLRQVVLHFRGIPYTHPPFKRASLYRYIRHPLMVGFLLAFWSAPTMTHGRLLFCLLTTGYILLGITLEERDLLQILGDSYRRYRAETPMLIPLFRRRG